MFIHNLDVKLTAIKDILISHGFSKNHDRIRLDKIRNGWIHIKWEGLFEEIYIGMPATRPTTDDHFTIKWDNREFQSIGYTITTIKRIISVAWEIVPVLYMEES